MDNTGHFLDIIGLRVPVCNFRLSPVLLHTKSANFVDM
jgi:hypothetical protein